MCIDHCWPNNVEISNIMRFELDNLRLLDTSIKLLKIENNKLLAHNY